MITFKQFIQQESLNKDEDFYNRPEKDLQYTLPIKNVNVSNTILNLIHKWKLEDNLTPKQICRGNCDTFAQELVNAIGGEVYEAPEFAHFWVERDGLAYDAETPNGVSDWKKLPVIATTTNPSIKESIGSSARKWATALGLGASALTGAHHLNKANKPVSEPTPIRQSVTYPRQKIDVRDIDAKLKRTMPKPSYYKKIENTHQKHKQDVVELGRHLPIIAKTLYAEARGEGIAGLRAVATVIQNRANDNPKHLAKVCLAKRQFSCWNSGPVIVKHQTTYEICKNIAETMLMNTFRPYQFKKVKTPTHYCTVNLYKTRPPKWAKMAKRSEVVGNHIFFEL